MSTMPPALWIGLALVLTPVFVLAVVALAIFFSGRDLRNESELEWTRR